MYISKFVVSEAGRTQLSVKKIKLFVHMISHVHVAYTLHLHKHYNTHHERDIHSHSFIIKMQYSDFSSIDRSLFNTPAEY